MKGQRAYKFRLYPDGEQAELFQKTAACALICIYEPAQFTFRLSPEHDVHMILIMVPFLQSQPVAGCNITEDLFRAI